MPIKLPKHLRKLISNAFSFRKYTIQEVYIDEKEYNMAGQNGVGKLREFLGISDSESVCDCFCRIIITDVGDKRFLFEDKNSKHEKRFFDAKTQLEVTNKYFEQKGIKIDYGVICKVAVQKPFEAVSDTTLLPPLKKIHVSINGNNVFIDNQNKIPLLYLS